MSSFWRRREARSFLWIWAGLTVSLVGSGLTSFALGVSVFQQTESTTQYALVMFCAALPPLIVLPLTGPIIDRLPRKRMLIGCDVLGALGTGGVAALAARDALTVPLACLLVIVISGSAALQWPTYSATVTRLVPSSELGRASGLTQLAQAAAHIAAPLLAGGLVVTIGLAGVAALDLATFAFSTITLLVATIPEPTTWQRERRPYAAELAFGWRFLFRHRGLATLLLMFALTNFFAELATVLFTPFVLTFSTPDALGRIVSVGGVGLLAGGLLLTVWGGPGRPARGAATFAGLGGLAVIGAAFTTREPLLAAVVAVFFFFLPLTSGASQVVWQRTVGADVQGRVFAVRSTVALSIVPLASIAAGPLADRVFEPALAAGGRWAGVLGPWFGVGPGRGIAVIFALAGAMMMLIALVGGLSRPLRRLDEPDSAAGPSGSATDQPLTQAS